MKQFHFKRLETKRFLNSSVDGAKTAAHASLHRHECCPSCCACQIDWLETKITRPFWGPTLSTSVKPRYTKWGCCSSWNSPKQVKVSHYLHCFFLHSFSASNVLQILPEKSPIQWTRLLIHRTSLSLVQLSISAFNSAFSRGLTINVAKPTPRSPKTTVEMRAATRLWRSHMTMKPKTMKKPGPTVATPWCSTFKWTITPPVWKRWHRLAHTKSAQEWRSWLWPLRLTWSQPLEKEIWRNLGCVGSWKKNWFSLPSHSGCVGKDSRTGRFVWIYIDLGHVHDFIPFTMDQPTWYVQQKKITNLIQPKFSWNWNTLPSPTINHTSLEFAKHMSTTC